MLKQVLLQVRAIMRPVFKYAKLKVRWCFCSKINPQILAAGEQNVPRDVPRGDDKRSCVVLFQPMGELVSFELTNRNMINFSALIFQTDSVADAYTLV